MLNKLWETFSLITWVEPVVISDFSYLDMNNIACGFENIKKILQSWFTPERQ